jgi:hypothetical protein
MENQYLGVLPGEVLHRYLRALTDFICDRKKYQQGRTSHGSEFLMKLMPKGPLLVTQHLVSVIAVE